MYLKSLFVLEVILESADSASWRSFFPAFPFFPVSNFIRVNQVAFSI